MRRKKKSAVARPAAMPRKQGSRLQLSAMLHHLIEHAETCLGASAGENACVAHMRGPLLRKCRRVRSRRSEWRAMKALAECALRFTNAGIADILLDLLDKCPGRTMKQEALYQKLGGKEIARTVCVRSDVFWWGRML